MAGYLSTLTDPSEKKILLHPFYGLGVGGADSIKLHPLGSYDSEKSFIPFIHVFFTFLHHLSLNLGS